MRSAPRCASLRGEGRRFRELLGDDGDAYKKAITKRYPAYQCAALIDVANAYMFGPKN
ncbi:hypothetical protein [Streptomyces sp. NPDC006510]|uniref:hypothetical protein n=1 Tax=Streptomyces sp. NPDC006510 TaxID=3155600 RepID=UPI0033AB08E0